MLNKSDFRKNRNNPESQWQKLLTPFTPNVPDHLCIKCDSCGKIQFKADIEANFNVCPDCGFHFRISAAKRLELVCDRGSFEEWDKGLVSCDPLSFPGYAAKLKKGRLDPEQKNEVICGRCRIGGVSCAVFAMEGSFMMGSMGSVVGEKITRVFERAKEEKLPVVGFTVSGGARMQEGMLSLMQMAKTSGAVKLHGDAGLLYITVLTDPTTGGVTASFAMEGDILISEPGALIAFAGPRVIEQTIRQKLPKNFQRSEYLLEHGFLDAVVQRPKMKRALAYLLRLHDKNWQQAKERAQEDADGSL